MLIVAIILICFSSAVWFFIYVILSASDTMEKEARRLLSSMYDDMMQAQNAHKKGGE